MRWVKGFASALLLGSSTVIAVTVSTGSALAAVPSSSSTVVIRGANEMTAPPSSDDDAPTVLRGSRPSPILPPAAYACPAGYLYDPSTGCVAPGYASAPYDNGYWPYQGFDGFDFGNRRHGFPHRFAGRASRGPA